MHRVTERAKVNVNFALIKAKAS